jgi:hypothetical protein
MCLPKALDEAAGRLAGVKALHELPFGLREHPECCRVTELGVACLVVRERTAHANHDSGLTGSIGLHEWRVLMGWGDAIRVISGSTCGEVRARLPATRVIDKRFSERSSCGVTVKRFDGSSTRRAGEPEK